MDQKSLYQNSVSQVNKLVLSITVVLNVLIAGGYLLEALRGTAPWYQFFTALVIGVVTILSSAVIYRAQPDSLRMRLCTAMGSLVLTAVALFMARTAETYTISFVLMMPYILYFDSGFIAWFGGAMLATNFGMTAMSFMTKPDYYAYSPSGVTIHLAASIVFYLALLYLTRLAVRLNDEKLEQIASVASEQEDMLASIMQIAGSIQENTQRGEQIGDQLNNNVGQVRYVLEDITGAVMQRSEQVMQEMDASTEQLRVGTETAVQTMRSLEEACDRIAGMTQLISTIAMQTNLLSLNAAVESARVGEAGRGFAVVADEVKQLAEKSMKSADEIDAIIRTLQSEAGEAARSMEQVNQITRQIGNVSRHSREVFGVIGQRIDEVHGLVTEVTQSVNEVAASNQSLSAEVETMVRSDTMATPEKYRIAPQVSRRALPAGRR